MTPVLTRHAYDRWCERAWWASMETVRCYVLTPERRRWIAMGASRITMPRDGVALVVQDNAVVTVVPISGRWRCARRTRRAGQGRRAGQHARVSAANIRRWDLTRD